MIKAKKIVILLLIFYLFLPQKIWAGIDFDKGKIIEDNDLFDCEDMSLVDIQKFLQKRNGTLQSYQAMDVNGQKKSAAEIIFDSANRHGINPKFLLVMLQKEQSLVEDDSPSQKQYDWATGYGVCDNCDPDDIKLSEYKGFGIQVDNAAALQKWYLENRNNGWLKFSGQTYVIDEQNIFIKNQATANLYNYTPHIAGNLNFWKIWNRWFNQKYPDGTLLQVKGQPGVWLIKDGFRRPFLTKSALVSRYNAKNIIFINQTELENYALGNPIKYANYSLLIDSKNNVYLLVDDILKPFESKEVLRIFGYNPEEFEPIIDAELSAFDIGEKIGLSSAYPAGALLQNKNNGGVYYVEDGVKHPVLSKDILQINFPKYKLTTVSTDELDKFIAGESVKLRDGELIKTADNPIVYAIANGEKHPIANADSFLRFGYKWQNIKIVKSESLANLALGDVLDYYEKNNN